MSFFHFLILNVSLSPQCELHIFKYRSQFSLFLDVIPSCKSVFSEIFLFKYRSLKHFCLYFCERTGDRGKGTAGKNVLLTSICVTIRSRTGIQIWTELRPRTGIQIYMKRMLLNTYYYLFHVYSMPGVWCMCTK